MADDIRLTDLEVIQRWSIAVRGETADRAEVVAALRADLAWIEGGRRTKAAKPAEASPAPTPAASRAAAARKPSAPAKPAAKVVATPAARSTAKPAARSTAKPAGKSTAKTTAAKKAPARGGRR